MALIIEDGSGVADSNSYITVIEARDYAEARGLELPTDDTEVEHLAVKANDYLVAIEEMFQGSRYDPTQSISFPRWGVELYGSDVSGTIPQILKTAQAQLTYDASQFDLLAPTGSREVIEEKVGPLVTKYNPTGSKSEQVEPVAALSFLKPLLTADGVPGGFNILIDR